MQNQHRTLICKRCGEHIDIRRRRKDGSLQCPKCKMIYRPRPAQPQQQSPMRRPQKRKKPIKQIVAFVVLLLLLIILIGSCGNEEKATAPVQTQQPIEEVNTTAQVDHATDTNDWEMRYNNTKTEVLTYLDTVFVPYQYYNEPYLDYTLASPDIYNVNADIIVNGDDVSAVKEALHYIENQSANSPYKFNFYIGMMSSNRATICFATFGEEHDGYTLLASGRITTYNTIDEIPDPSNKTETASLAIVPTQKESVTIGERNALSRAKAYLEYTAFSYIGLGKQLMYEGFTKDEAKYGVDNCGANWNEQAAKKAASYLEYMSFSRDGLIEQLEYEDFTHDQAVYGVAQVGY